MKSIIKIHLCVLLLTIVWNGVGGNKVKKLSDKLHKMANENEEISDIFKPSKNGLLGTTDDSVCYKGYLIRKRMNVSMKFTMSEGGSDNELNMYIQMHAIGDTNLEVYGVPAIHHYGTWRNIFMMAMTLFDPGYQQTFRDQNLTPTDLLILFRELVRITQYTHKLDVFHQQIHLSNIMFRGKASFIYDFTVADKYENGIRQDGLYAAREDWQQILRAMYTYIRESSNWSWLGFSDHDSHRTETLDSFFASLKNDYKSNDPHKFSGLRRVFVEFAGSALSDARKPITKSFYDRPSQVILEEIEICAQQQQGESLAPSWLSQDQDNVQSSSSSSWGSET